MKLKKALVVYKGCTVKGNVTVVVQENVLFKEVGGSRSISVPMDRQKKIAKDIPVLVTLQLPKGTSVNRVAKANDDATKCRASQAKVVSIVDQQGNSYDSATSTRDKSFAYKVGETVKPDRFDTGDYTCSGGIHFYRTPKGGWSWVGVRT